MGGLIVFLLLVGIAISVYVYMENAAQGKDVIRTTMPASQVIRLAVQEIGTERKWTASGHSSDFASFNVNKRASCLLALFLALFWILPGIIYMVVGGKTQSLSINVFPDPDGTNSVQASSSGGEAKRRGRRFLGGLPKVPALDAAQAEALTQAAPGGAALPAGSPEAQVASAPPPPPEVTRPSERATQIEAATQDDPTAGSKVFCDHCGGQMKAEDKFCPNCGKEPLEAK